MSKIKDELIRKHIILSRPTTLTDKESKEYEKHMKAGIYVGINVYRDADEKHIRYANFYLYHKGE